MANITLLHWNIETFAWNKYNTVNGPRYVEYFAQIVFNTNANIFSIVEVKNNMAGILPPALIIQLNTLQGFTAANTPWRSITIDSGKNSEAYIMLYRTDQNFLPVNFNAGNLNPGANVVPVNGLGNETAAGGNLQFPTGTLKTGGRRPFVVAFQTTDTNNTFSVIEYHAQFGSATPNGVIRLPSLNYITRFNDAPPPYTVMEGSLIAGDFNVDYIANVGYYQNMLNLPSTHAVNADTTLQDNPVNSNDPAAFMKSAYDNIFQKIPMGGVANAGAVVNLMVESAVVPGPPSPLPAAQPGAGNLSVITGNFNVAAVNALGFVLQNPIAVLPPVSMDLAWDFVRKGISNHYPVVVTTTI